MKIKLGLQKDYRNNKAIGNKKERLQKDKGEGKGQGMKGLRKRLFLQSSGNGLASVSLFS